MTDYRDFFKKAVAATHNRYPFPDDSEIIGSVKERAKNMENKKTKTHSGFYAVAGTAAALALAGGSLLGVNWLHENIGVNAGGAAYHDDTAADIAEPGGDILQAVGDIIRFGDMTVTITEADFDGQFLRVACKPEFTGEAPEGAEPGNIEICVRDGSSNVLIGSSTSSYNEETGCCTVGCYVDLKPGQIAKISFSSPEYHKDMTDFDIGEHGNYALTGMNMEGIAYVGETEPGTTVTVTKFGAFIESTNNYAEYDRFRVAVIYNDGTEKVLTDRRQRTGYDPERVSGYSGGYLYNFEAMTGSVSLFSDSAEPIDVENIASVTIDAVQLDHTTVDGWTEAGNADSSVNVNDTADFAPVTEWAGLKFGEKLEFRDYYATLNNIRTSGIFTELFFDIEYKDQNNVYMPLMNLGEQSWYCVDGAPFDSRVYAMGYDFKQRDTYHADFSFVVYNGLEPGETLEAGLYSVNFPIPDENSEEVALPEYEKGADMILTGAEITDEECKPYEAYPGIVIGENELGSAVLDHILIQGWCIRMDISYPEGVIYAPNVGLTTDNMLWGSAVVIKYKDGTVHERNIFDSSAFTDSVNGRHMAYMFDSFTDTVNDRQMTYIVDNTDAHYLPKYLDSVYVRAADGTEVRIF